MLLNFLVVIGAIVNAEDVDASYSALLADSGEDSLRESVITAELSPRALVKKAAKKFAENYWRDYAAEIMVVRTVSSDGRYREIQAGVGTLLSSDFTQKPEKFYWDDPNRLENIGFADSFVSETLYPWSNEVNPLFSVSGRNKRDEFSISYYDSFDLSVLNKKRSLELWSPLNPKRVQQFDYEYDENSSDIACSRVVKFHTRDGVSWKDSRISCPEGRIYIDEACNIVGIEVLDMEDRYSEYVRNFSEKSRMVTPYSLSVTYGRVGERVYTKRIIQHLEWKNDGSAADDNILIYAAENNSFRSPFKYKLSADVRMDFCAPVDVSREDCSALKRILSSGIYWRDSSDFGWWRKKLSEYVDLPGLLNDMGMDWEDLCESTMMRQARYFDNMLANRSNYGGDVSEEKVARMKTYYLAYRDVFKQLFGKSYNEE